MARFDITPALQEYSLLTDAPRSFTREQHDRIDAIWNDQLLQRPGRLHDGMLLEFIAIDGPQITGRFVNYKAYIASQKDPAAAGRAIAPLSVSGLTWASDSVGFARRADHVRGYPGWLESFPSGSIDATFLLGNGSIDYQAQLLNELWEETGVRKDQVLPTRTLALIHDKIDNVYDICVELVTDLSATEFFRANASAPHDEYSDFSFVSRRELSQFIQDHHDRLVPTSVAILQTLGYLPNE